MSNYTKSTNFATKDSLPSGDALKIVKGTEIDTEFNNIATAIATKADLERFATKADLEKYATKADLERFATKADLISFRDAILDRFQVLAEESKDSVQKAAEGYGETLDRIERDLGAMNRKLDDGLTDHATILAEHTGRITALETPERWSRR